MTPQPSSPSVREMLEELIDLSAGFGVALLPALLLAVPGIILFVVLPGILLLALALPVAVLGALLAVPYLLARRIFTRSGRRHVGAGKRLSSTRGVRPAQ